MVDSPDGDNGGSGEPSKIEEFGERLSGIVRAHPVLLVGVLLFAAFVWVMRPWFQPFYYAIRFEYIGFFAYLGVTIVVALGAKAAFGANRKKVGYTLGVLVIVLAVITLASPFMAGVLQDKDLSERTTTSTPETSDFSQAPTIDVDNTRTMTFKGAETQAQTSYNEPTHTLTNGELVMHNGSLSTSYAQEPEGIYKTFTRQQQGVVFVNINSQSSDVKQVNQKFKCGRGMLIFDDVQYQIQKDNMNTKLTNPTTFQGNDGELYNMYSGIQHDVRFGFAGPIPMLYSVPEYSSVHLSDTDCNQERLTPEEAVNDSRMDGKNKQQFYPYSLMRAEVIATNLQNGWINTITDKEGMKEFSDTKSIDNRPPFTMMMDDGTYKQVMTMEAIGGGTGVFEVYIGDGRTGEKKKYTFNSTRKGPGYAVDATITANSERFAEGNSEGSDKLTVSEVYPVFRNGELWYQVNAVQSGTGIYGFTAFYNPQSDTLLKAYTDAQIQAFYSGSDETHEQSENVIDGGDSSNEGREVDDPSLWIVIEDEESGDTYTVPVGSGETVSVNQDAPDNSTDTDN